MTEAINIYLGKDSSYYYSTKKQNKKDKLISKHVSIEYAFEFCAAKNYGEKKGFAAAKTFISGTPKKDHPWHKEQQVFLAKCGKKNTTISE